MRFNMYPKEYKEYMQINASRLTIALCYLKQILCE